MTNDKIKHYLGAQIFEHISSLDETKLQKMKKAIVQDMNLNTLPASILFTRTIELEYINRRLKN